MENQELQAKNEAKTIKTKAYKLAITGEILAGIGYFIYPLIGILGIILGILSFKKMTPEEKQGSFRGVKGHALSSTIIGVICLVVSVVAIFSSTLPHEDTVEEIIRGNSYIFPIAGNGEDIEKIKFSNVEKIGKHKYTAVAHIIKNKNSSYNDQLIRIEVEIMDDKVYVSNKGRL